MVLVVALIFRVPYAPLIAVIAGMIVFIPWIGPLIGWAVLPGLRGPLRPEVVLPCLILSLIGAIGIQLIVTQFVMGAAVNMSPVAVFVGGHPRDGGRRHRRRHLRDPDRRGDPRDHRLPAPARRPAAGGRPARDRPGLLAGPGRVGPAAAAALPPESAGRTPPDPDRRREA